MRRSRRRAARILLALGVLAVIAPLGVAQEVTDRDRRAAQVIYDTIRLRRDVGAPSDEDVRAYKNSCGETSEGGVTLCFSNSGVSDGQGGSYSWTCRIRFLPDGWSPNPELERRWEQHFERRDPSTGETAYYELSARRMGRVSMKVRRGGTMLVLYDLRGPDLPRAEHLRRAERRWRFFVEEAERRGLLGPSRTWSVATRATESHPERTLRDGDVVSIDSDLARTAEIPLTIVFEPGHEERAGLRLTLDEEGTREVEVLRDGQTLRPAADGSLALALDGDVSSVNLSVRFRPLEIDSLRPIGQATLLTFRSPDRKGSLAVTLHRTDWFPVVRRFEVVPTGPDPSSKGDSVLGDVWKENQWTHAYGDVRVLAGWLVSSWRELARTAAIRPGLDPYAPGGAPTSAAPTVYAPHESVLQGWKDDDGLGQFECAEVRAEWPTADHEDPSRSESELSGRYEPIASWPQGERLAVRLDLWLAHDLRPGVPGRWDDVHRQALELRGQIEVAKHSIEIVRVTPDWAGTLPGDSEYVRKREYEKLVDIIRLPTWSEPLAAGHAPNVLTLVQDFGATRTLAANDDVIPFDRSSYSAGFTIRRPGIYEVRFALDLRGPSSEKSVLCAIRINVVPKGFELRRPWQN